jgi:hypothetical protein
MLMLRDSIDSGAEIQRQLQAGAYNPPWEHTLPAQATFTVELVIPNKQAEVIKAEYIKYSPRAPDMCPFCEVYNDGFTARQTTTTKGVPGENRPGQPRTVIKPELTVALPCGCKMHYDCVLHTLRGYEAYIYAEEHRYFECPRCGCEYNQEERWYMDRRLSLYMPAEYECRIWERNYQKRNY